MFTLAELHDSVNIQPEDLGKDTLHAITSELRKTFLNKVIPDLGLAVALHNITGVDGGFVPPGEGAVHFEVAFRLLLFKPFKDEVIVGTTQSCTREGIAVTLGFFDDIIVPADSLPDDYQFREEAGQGTWVWRYEGSELHVDRHNPIRVKVSNVAFPPLPLTPELKTVSLAGPIPKGLPGNPFAPMEVTAVIGLEGLGPLNWWEEGDEMAVDEEAAGAGAAE